MSFVTKFGLEQFDGKNDFPVWQAQVKAVLVHNKLKKALQADKPDTMSDEEWKDLDEMALTTVHLCLSKKVLRRVLDETTAFGLWKKLDLLYKRKETTHKLQRSHAIHMDKEIPPHPDTDEPDENEKDEQPPWYRRGIFNAFHFTPEWMVTMCGHILTAITVFFSTNHQGVLNPPEVKIDATKRNEESVHAAAASMRRQYLNSGAACLIGVVVAVVLLAACGANLFESHFLATIVTMSMLGIVFITINNVLEMMSIIAQTYEPTWKGDTFYWVLWTLVIVAGVLLVLRCIGFAIDTNVRRRKKGRMRV